MKWVCGAALAVTLAGGMAPAQDLGVDAGAVEACFAGAPPWTGVPDCLGEAANRCQGLPGGATTIGIADCLGAETAAWDAILNREYKATRAHVDRVDPGQPPVSEALLTAQRAWIAYRDAECRLAFERNRGGTIRSVAAADCVLRMTARRALELRDMREGM